MDFYKASDANVNRTVIQGMKPRPLQETQAGPAGGEEEPSRREREIRLQDRPLAGALFSASADGLGEIYPIYVGRNTIGSSEESDLYLSEGSVAPNHAVILVRRLRGADGREVTRISITDYDSEFGTVVNGERLAYDSCQLRGGEVIQVGRAYRFLLRLFDSTLPGLGESPDFFPLERKRHEPAPHDMLLVVEEIEKEEEIFPDTVGAADEFAFYGRSKPAENLSQGTTVDNLSELYGSASKRTPGKAPGTVLK